MDKVLYYYLWKIRNYLWFYTNLDSLGKKDVQSALNTLNGLIYNFKSHKELALCIDDLLDNPDKAKRLGKAAYETIVNMWNASNAADRFIALSSKLLEGKSFFEEEGPLSNAENISMRHAYKLCRKDEVI